MIDPMISLRHLLDALPMGAAILSVEGRVLVVNRAWATSGGCLGWPTMPRLDESIVGRLQQKAQNGNEQAARVLAGIEAVADGSVPEFLYEYPCDETGQRRRVRLTVRPLDEGGAPHRVLLLCENPAAGPDPRND